MPHGAICRNDPINFTDPLGLDYVTTEGNNAYWVIEKDNFWYNPDVRKILVGAVSDGQVAFNKSFGGGSGSLDLLKKYAEHFWERPDRDLYWKADISGTITPIQDLVLKDYIQHYVRDDGRPAISEYRGAFQPKTVGEPGTAEGFAPVWGSGRQAIYDYQTGHYVWGTVNSAFAVSDVFLVKSVATMAGKGAWKVGSTTWGATRKWLGKRGYAEAGQHVHHGVVAREAFEGTSWEKLFNQPWNLKPLDPPSGIDRNTWHRMVEGKEPGLTALGRWWEGTPDWLRYAEISGAGRLVNTDRDGGTDDSR